MLSLTLIVVLGTSLASASPLCQKAKSNIDKHLASLPARCKVVEDCEPFYIRGDGCAAPVVLNKSFHVEKDSTLLKLQEAVRTACAEEWENRGVCGPQHVNMACVQGRCAAN